MKSYTLGGKFKPVELQGSGIASQFKSLRIEEQWLDDYLSLDCLHLLKLDMINLDSSGHFLRLWSGLQIPESAAVTVRSFVPILVLAPPSCLVLNQSEPK